MWRRRRVVAGVAATGVAAGLAWFLLRDGGSTHDTPTGTATGAHGAARLGHRGVAGVPRWFAQPGLEPRRIAGRVTYHGATVAGATVRLEVARQLRLVMPLAEATSGADGSFDFGLQLPASLLVTASAVDRGPAGAIVDLRDPTRTPPPDHLELALADCAQTLLGKVHDHGGPIAGAMLRAATTEESIAIATTDEDGAYQLCVGPGGGQMSVAAEGYARVELDIGSGRRVRRDIELSPEATLAGIVVGPDENPVAEALVTARSSEWGPKEMQASSTQTATDGRFSLGGIAPGRYSLTARDAGRKTAEPVEVVALVGGSEDVTLHLVAMVTVKGRITEDGQPVAGARIVPRTGNFMRVGRSFAPYAEAVSQSDGSFVLDAVPPGEFSIAVDEYEVLEPTRATATLPETEVLVKVATKASVAGRVIRDGTPVAGATVRMMGIDRSWGGWAKTRTDGLFEMRGVDPGAYEIRASTETAFAREVPVTVAKGQQLTGLDIELDLAGEISGIVVDQQGKPVGGVAVVFEMGPKVDWGFATTEEDGTFVAGAMSGGGAYAVTVKPSRSSSIDLAPAPGTIFPSVSLADGRSRATDIRIAVQLDRKEISGVVVGADGKPAPDVKVSAFPPLQSSFMMRFTQPAAEVVTGAEGTFTLSDVIAGDYTVRASAGTGLEVTEEKVAAGRTNVRLRLPAIGAIDGSLVGFGKQARVSATSTGLTTSLLDSFAGRVSGDHFTIAALPPGSYMVTARDGARADQALAEVVAGKTATVTLTSKGTATVSGRAVDLRTREPLAGLECSEPAGWREGGLAAVTDAQGRFRLEVKAGRLTTVHCMSPTRRFRTMGHAEVDLEPNTTGQVLVEVIVARRAGPMTGDLGLHIQPGPPATVYKVEPGGPAERAGVRVADAVLKVDGVAAGTLTSSQVLMLMLDHKVGEKVELVLGRGGREIAASVEVTARGR